jgi:hypothetical protein
MRSRSLTLVAVVALMVAACGGGASEETVAAEDTQVDDQTQTTTAPNPDDGDSDGGETDSGEPAPPPQGGADGEFSIDGEDLGITRVVRCEPYVGPSSTPHPDDLDLVAEGNGAILSLVVSNFDGRTATQELFEQIRQEARVNRFTEGGQEQFVSYASHDADDNWYLNFNPVLGDQVGDTPLDGPPFTISGDRISGTLHLIMDFPDEGASEMDVTFDVPIPSNLVDC